MSLWDDVEAEFYVNILPVFVRKGNKKLTIKRDTEYLHGYIYWAKVLPKQLRPNYNEDGREWSFEFEPDEDAHDVIGKKYRLKDRFKDKFKKDGTVRKNYEDRDNDFIILRRAEFNADGEANDPIRIVDAANQKWNERLEIGNKTEADVKVQIVDYGPGKKRGIYPIAIRVLELVPYERKDFAPLAADDPRATKAREKYAGPSVEEDFGGDDGDTLDEAPDTPDAEELDDEMPA